MSRYFEAMRSRARAARRHRREVHRRRRDGGLRRPAAARGRRAARGPGRGRDARGARPPERGASARSWGVTLSTRTGVNTGEVVAGDPTGGQAFVTGDAVNVAARLEQAAEPGEILIGEATLRLVRDAVVVEDAGPLDAQGRSGTGAGVALLEVTPGAPGWTRQLDSHARRPRERARPSAGRSTAEPSSRDVRARHGHGRRGRRQVPARATSSSRGSADGATRRSPGSCLPYGEGITFRPDRRRHPGRSRASVERDPPGGAGEALRSSCRRAPRRRTGRGPARRPASVSRRRHRGSRRRSGRSESSSSTSARQSPARRRLRRHPLGRADVPRPPRVPRRLDPVRSRGVRLPRPAGAARTAPRLGSGPGERHPGDRWSRCSGPEIGGADPQPVGGPRRSRAR